ncbi:hypothetical protein [Neobacillus mesonae]|nr:hypothetical protein [Neobacillus mesonae]MCM3571113.1 hypothetical protein [Neobacillus mesonae]
MQIVEERAPEGFNNLNDVISFQELENVSNTYKQIVGFDPEILNSK